MLPPKSNTIEYFLTVLNCIYFSDNYIGMLLFGCTTTVKRFLTRFALHRVRRFPDSACPPLETGMNIESGNGAFDVV